jgi:hypothetical protein
MVLELVHARDATMTLRRSVSRFIFDANVQRFDQTAKKKTGRFLDGSLRGDAKQRRGERKGLGSVASSSSYL